MTCNAELLIADDHGDNHATMKCQLEAGHDLPHREEFKRAGTPVVVTWECDEREDVSCTLRVSAKFDDEG